MANITSNIPPSLLAFDMHFVALSPLMFAIKPLMILLAARCFLICTTFLRLLQILIVQEGLSQLKHTIGRFLVLLPCSMVLGSRPYLFWPVKKVAINAFMNVSLADADLFLLFFFWWLGNDSNTLTVCSYFCTWWISQKLPSSLIDVPNALVSRWGDGFTTANCCLFNLYTLSYNNFLRKVALRYHLDFFREPLEPIGRRV